LARYIALQSSLFISRVRVFRSICSVCKLHRVASHKPKEKERERKRERERKSDRERERGEGENYGEKRERKRKGKRRRNGERNSPSFPDS